MGNRAGSSDKYIFYVYVHDAVKLVYGKDSALKGGPGIVHKEIQAAAVLCLQSHLSMLSLRPYR